MPRTALCREAEVIGAVGFAALVANGAVARLWGGVQIVRQARQELRAPVLKAAPFQEIRLARERS